MKNKKFKKISKNIYEVENVFPKKVAEKIFSKFKKNDSKSWKLIIQKKPENYSTLFKNYSKFLPDEDEIYLAKFYRSNKLRNNPYIKQSIQKFILPLFKKYLKYNIKSYEIRCHKLKKNNHIRLHFDDYAGSYSANLNFNKTWKWDWGGILSIPGGNNGKKLFSICPGWNSLNIYLSGKKNTPHFVTPVQSFAKSPRYSITIFIK